MDQRRIKAVLVDDEEKSRHNLRKLLEIYCPEVEVTGEAADFSNALKVLDQFSPDVLFLDIEMQEGSGFTLLEKIKERPFHIIFVTAHSHYAIKAFKFEATDYLLKPIDIDELRAAVQKVKVEQKAELPLKKEISGKDYLELKVSEGFIYVPLKDIIRLEAEGSYTYLYESGGGKHCMSYHLGYFESRLNGDFFRVHKSHIINLRFVVKIRRLLDITVQMADGASIDVSRRLKAGFLQRIRSV